MLVLLFRIRLSVDVVLVRGLDVGRFAEVARGAGLARLMIDRTGFHVRLRLVKRHLIGEPCLFGVVLGENSC